jgi:hypothetical protein
LIHTSHVKSKDGGTNREIDIHRAAARAAAGAEAPAAAKGQEAARPEEAACPEEGRARCWREGTWPRTVACVEFPLTPRSNFCLNSIQKAKKDEIRLKKEFHNTTPKGEKKGAYSTITIKLALNNKI